MPPGYEWDNIDIKNDEVAKEMYDLLTQNYVEDEDALFRFDYSVPFLRWSLMPPGYNPDWLVCVSGEKKKRMFGCITGKIRVQVLISYLDFFLFSGRILASF